MRVLITGCSGFIGFSAGHFAAGSGHTVFGVSRSASRPMDWLGEYESADVAGDDLSSIIRSFKPDLILHASGSASVSASLAAPLQDLRAAVLPWANLLDSVSRSECTPLVLFPSSAAVYGNPTSLPMREDAALNPISPYGFHKTMCELLAREAAECSGLRIIVCRLFSVFGVRQQRLLVWELFRQLIGDNPVAWLEGSGAESRDFLHVDDLASAVLGIAESRLNSPAGHFEIVNLASGEETTVADLALQIRDIVAPSKEIRCRGNSRPGDPANWRADISRLRALIPSWSPRPLRDGLHDCLNSWQQESSVYRNEG